MILQLLWIVVSVCQWIFIEIRMWLPRTSPTFLSTVPRPQFPEILLLWSTVWSGNIPHPSHGDGAISHCQHYSNLTCPERHLKNRCRPEALPLSHIIVYQCHSLGDTALNRTAMLCNLKNAYIARLVVKVKRIKQTKNLKETDNSMVITKVEGGWGR